MFKSEKEGEKQKNESQTTMEQHTTLHNEQQGKNSIAETSNGKNGANSD